MARCDTCLMLTLTFLKFDFVFGSLFMFSASEYVTVQSHLLRFKIMYVMSVIYLRNML